jgi:hypothetical protein
MRALLSQSWTGVGLLCLLTRLVAGSILGAELPTNARFQIQVTDAATGRGVPLVELETVDHLRLVTDSAGRIAFQEPGLMNRTVFFSVRSHGYDLAPDGFGIVGKAFHTVPGGKAVLPLRRLNLAERLYRLTGEGIYRDSILLGESVPLAEPLLNAQVVGQDSTQATLYRGKIYWFWGDTSRLGYPLGNFRASGATSERVGSGGLDPAQGVDLRYFTRSDGFTKEMCPFEPREGVVWIDGLLTVPTETGHDLLVAHFTRLKGLGAPLEHGLAIFNDQTQQFDRTAAFSLDEPWRCPRGQAVPDRASADKHAYFCTPFPTVRVLLDLPALSKPAAYQAWTCLQDGSSTDPKAAQLRRAPGGALLFTWSSKASPVGPKEEQGFIAAGLMRPDEAFFQPRDVVTGQVIQLHSGSVRWNEWRQRWILIAVQQGGSSSFLGEVWYGEAPALTGPWKTVQKIVSHQRYTFYNPVQHSFFDQEGGRWIYFEGTYSKEFSGNTDPTPRYDYNQILYRLDLNLPQLRPVRNPN